MENGEWMRRDNALPPLQTCCRRLVGRTIVPDRLPLRAFPPSLFNCFLESLG